MPTGARIRLIFSSLKLDFSQEISQVENSNPRRFCLSVDENRVRYVKPAYTLILGKLSCLRSADIRKPAVKMEERNRGEIFETGLRKIRQELKSQLAAHGLYGTFTEPTSEAPSSPPIEATIEIAVKGRVARRSFERQQIESCHLRVTGAVLKEIASIVEELVT